MTTYVGPLGVNDTVNDFTPLAVGQQMCSLSLCALDNVSSDRRLRRCNGLLRGVRAHFSVLGCSLDVDAHQTEGTYLRVGNSVASCVWFAPPHEQPLHYLGALRFLKRRAIPQLMIAQAETLDKQFEKPLRQHLEDYRTVVTVRPLLFQRKSHCITSFPSLGKI